MPIIAKTGRYRSISKSSMPKIRAKYGERMIGARANLTMARHKLDKVMEYIEEDLSPEAIEAVLSVMQTVAKSPSRPGAWRDRTGNLRDSIMIDVLKPREVKMENYHHGRTAAYNESDILTGILYAGMEYGASLETKPGYSVLGYAVESMRNRMTPVLAQKLKITGGFGRNF